MKMTTSVTREKMIEELYQWHKPAYSREFFAGLTDKALQNWYEKMQTGKALKQQKGT
jgi:hypothetical protein